MNAHPLTRAPGGPADELARAALTVARSFAAGARMWCVAPPWPAHAHHVAVEFVHPVIVGTRALPTTSLDAADAAAGLRLLARPGDILMVIGRADDGRAADLLRRAEAWGLSRLWLGAGPRPPAQSAEHVLWVDGPAPALAAHSGDLVLLYHLLWELTHVVFEHPGLLRATGACTEEVCITCSDEGRVAEVHTLLAAGLVEVIVEGRLESVDASLVEPVAPGDLVLVHAGVALTALEVDAGVSAEPTGFLYPFIESEERDAASLLDDLAASARTKMEESRTLRVATLERWADRLEETGAAMAARFDRGARLFAFGNGGSATDAEGAVQLFRHPPEGRALPALSLVDDRAVLTALANDVGFELVFSRQLIAHARAGDIAVGFSTSGDSANLLRAFEEAARRGLLTVGLGGYEGSAMARSDAVRHCLGVGSESVHRIQETQAALVLGLWSIVQRHLGGIP